MAAAVRVLSSLVQRSIQGQTSAETTQEEPSKEPAVLGSDLQDPHAACWSRVQWTVYRGRAFDLSDFIHRHPGGAALARLAVGRDCTALVESNHLRDELALATLAALPVLEGFPVSQVPAAPRPGDSQLYRRIRHRVQEEVFHHGGSGSGSCGGSSSDGASGSASSRGSRRGGRVLHRGDWTAAAVVLPCWAAAYTLFLWRPSLLTGLLHGIAVAWVALVTLHGSNHGSLAVAPWANAMLALPGDLTCNSSLVWRYHHQVSHHIHTNDPAADEDVFNSYPFLRFDPALPRRWWHRWQHMYMWFAFTGMWLGFLVEDIEALLLGCCHGPGGVRLHGATTAERLQAAVGKAGWLAVLICLPLWLHGPRVLLLVLLGHSAASLLDSVLFLVNHSLEAAKPAVAGSPAERLLHAPPGEADWAAQQIVASANWGGSTACWLTGGLNLQIEHHLFPTISPCHYPTIAPIVAQECSQAGVPYTHHRSLAAAVAACVCFMRWAGTAEGNHPKAH